ncbi:PLP-dependent aminotransferase family protein, partial [Ruminococcus bicirculans (ex Wegman et al. 2014)]
MTYKFSEKVSHLQASAIREILKFTADPEVISSAAGNPSPEAFHVDELNRL